MKPAPADKALVKSAKEVSSFGEATSNGAPVARFTKTFRDGSLQVVLQQWDFTVDGGALMIILDSCNTKVKDSPAVFVAYQPTVSGSTLYELTWATDKQQFALYAKGFADGDSAYDYLMRVARSL